MRTRIAGLLIFIWIATGVFAYGQSVRMQPVGHAEQRALLDQISVLTTKIENAKIPSARALLWYDRALLLMQINEPELAKIDALKAHQLSRGAGIRSQTTALLGQIAFAQGSYSLGAGYLAGPHITAPLSDAQTVSLAQCLFHMNHFIAANGLFDDALPFAPYNANAFADAVETKIRLGLIDQARTLAFESLASSKGQSDPEAFVLCARAEYADRDFIQATEWIQKALEYSKSVSPERKETFLALHNYYTELANPPKDAQGNQSQGFRTEPVDNFRSFPQNAIPEHWGAIASSDPLSGLTANSLYLSPDSKLSLTPDGPCLVRLSVRLVDAFPDFRNGQVGAHIKISTGNKQYRLPVLFLSRSIRRQVKNFDDAYLTWANVFYIPMSPADDVLQIEVDGNPVSLSISKAAPRFPLGENGQMKLAADKSTKLASVSALAAVYDPWTMLDAANTALTPGWGFDPNQALHLLEKLGAARPDLAFVKSAAGTVRRMLKWIRYGVIVDSAGEENAELHGAQVPIWLSARDALYGKSFEPGTYAIVSPGSPVRIRTQGLTPKTLTFKLLGLNPAIDPSVSEELRTAAVEVFLGDRLVLKKSFTLYELTQFQVKDIPGGRRNLRIRIGLAFAGTHARIQCLDAATGEVLMPKVKATYHVASAEIPVRIDVNGPARLKLSARWMHYDTVPEKIALRVLVRDKNGAVQFADAFALPKQPDDAATSDSQGKRFGLKQSFEIDIRKAGVFSIFLQPESPDSQIALALAPTQSKRVGWALPLAPYAPLTNTQAASIDLPTPDRYSQQQQRIRKSKGGSFLFEASYGRDELEFTDLVDQQQCDDCDSQFVDLSATHRIYFGQAKLYQRLNLGTRHIFDKPTLTYLGERASWNTGLGALTLVGDGHGYVQNLDTETAWSGYFKGRLKYAVGPSVFLTTPVLGGFYRALSLSDPARKIADKVEPVVWSQFQQDHPYGLFAQLRFSSRPISGLRVISGITTATNSDFSGALLDRVRPYAGIDIHTVGLTLSPYFSYPIYLPDTDRRSQFERSEWSFNVRWGRWAPWGDRYGFFAGIRHLSNTKETFYMLGLRYQWLRGRGLYDIDPALLPFKSAIESVAPQHMILERSGW
jgi:tetratricopeptide (TPR) repeat protein